MRVSQLLCDFPDIQELDINPLRVFDQEHGCQALDVRIILAVSRQLSAMEKS